MTEEERTALLATMKASGGGEVALAMETHHVLVKILKVLERIAAALEEQI